MCHVSSSLIMFFAKLWRLFHTCFIMAVDTSDTLFIASSYLLLRHLLVALLLLVRSMVDKLS